MIISNEVLKRMKEEIMNDPYNRGYLMAKSDKEVADIMNTPFTIPITVEEYHMPRITELINAMPSEPNTVTEEDITKAKAFVTL